VTSPSCGVYLTLALKGLTDYTRIFTTFSYCCQLCKLSQNQLLCKENLYYIWRNIPAALEEWKM